MSLESILKNKTDRRKGPDIWVKALRWAGIIGWLAMLVSYILLDRAKPERGTFIDMMYFEQLGIPVNVSSQWDADLVSYIFFLMVLGLCISVAWLLINAGRHRRKDDGYRKYLVFLGLTSLFGVVYYFF
jgi:formate hydrogenlyase subunit 3/multisubunit Na+/H+ antiporter MnhD subunit